MIELGKQYRTRDGSEVRIYSVDGGGIAPVHGAILYAPTDGVWYPMSWMITGKVKLDYDHPRDLIEVKPRRRRTIWVNVYSDPNLDRCYITKALANYWCTPNRIACIKVELDFEEGDGL